MFSVLYVDDERYLLEIGKLFLEQYPDLRVDVHISAKEALASEHVGTYDAIVSDYQMPEMDGIEFLKTVRGRYGDIPFILFTGRGREEVVIQAINNGVDFYLQKGGDVRAQFAELAHKIRQAVARHRAELSLIESEKRLSDIINFLPDATFAISRDGIIIAWNRAIEEMTGLPAETILGKGDHEYALPFYGERRPILIDLIFEPDEVIEQKYSHIVRQKDVLIADTTLPRLKGKEVTLLGKASPLYNSQGEIVGAIEAIRDITVQKNAEDELRAAYEQITASEEELRDQLDVLEGSEKKIRESEARLRYMIGFYEKAKDPEQELLGYAVEGVGAVTESPLGYLAFLNDDESELSMYAWSRSAMKECTLRDKPIVYKTEETGLWGEAVRQRSAVITNDYASPNPAKKGYPPGHPGIVRHMNVPIMDGGHIVLVAGVANKPADYTDTDVQELQLLMQSLWLVVKRRRTEGALLESEEKYRDLFESSVLGIFRTTREGKFSAINGTFARIAGYDSPQQMMETITDVRTQLYVNPEDRDRFVNGLTTDAVGKDFEVQFYHRDGHAIWILINARAVRDAQGEVRYYEGTIEDITEQKNTKEALQKEKTFSDAVLESIPGLLYLYDCDGNLIRWNRSHETVSGYSAEELGRMHLLDWFKGDDEAIRVISEGVAQALKEGQSSAVAKLLTKSGKRIPFFFTAKRLEIEGKTYFTGVGIDITDRQRVQDELRTANEQLSASQKELQGQLDELTVSEQRIRESEEKYRELAELLPQMVFEMDPGFRVTYANRYAHSAFGLSEQDLKQGFSALSCIDPGQHERARLAIENIIAGKPEVNPEYIGIRKDGTRFPVLIYTAPVYHAQALVGFRGVIVDISDRKKAENALRESAAMLASIFRAAPVGIGVVSDRVLLNVNDQLCEMTGYSAEQLIGKSARILYPDEGEFERVGREKYEQIRKSGTGTVETRWQRKDGAVRDVLLSSTPLDPENPAAGVTFTALDFTDRKQAENDLHSSRNLMQSIFDAVPDLLIVVNRQFRVLYSNYKGHDSIAPRDPNKCTTCYGRFKQLDEPCEDCSALPVFETGETVQREMINPADGRIREVRAFPIRDSSGKVSMVVEYVRDITEQKQAEEELRSQYEELALAQEKLLKSQHQLAEIAGTVPGVVYQFYARPDGSMGVNYVSSRAEEIFGFDDRKQDFFSWFTQQVDPLDRDAFLQSVAEVVKAGQPWNFEGRFIKPSGEKIWFQGISRPIARQGELVYSGVLLDITEQKLAEEALRESEERYRNILELLPLGMHFYELLPDGLLIFTGANPAADTILGIDNNSFIGKTIEEAFPGLVGTEIPDQYRKVAADGGVWHTDQVIYDQEEIRGAFAVQAFQIRQHAMVTVFYDITKRKKAEAALRESEKKYRTILENIQDVYYRTDTAGNLVMASPSITGLLGYAHLDALIGKNIALDIWQYPDRREAFIGEIKKQGFVKNYEVIMKRKDGSPVAVATSSHFHYDRTGAVAGVEGIFHDITAIREADQQIQLLATLIDISPASVTVHDAEGRFLYANQRTFDLHGYTREEFQALNLHQLDVPVSEELINERIQALKQKGEASFDVEHFRKDGSTFPLQVIAKLTRWNDQDVILSVATDITRRIAAEQELREAEKNYRTLVENSQSIIYTILPDGIMTFVSPSWTTLLGHEPSEVVDHDFRSFVHKDDIPACNEFLQKTVVSGTTQPGIEYRVFNKDGSIHWHRSNITPVFDDQNSLVSFVGNAVDITEQMSMEYAIREANNKLNLLNSMTRHDVTNQLTVLQGFAQIAAMKKGDPVMADYLAKILAAADTIARQIEFTRTYQELGVKAPAWTTVEDVISHVESRVPVKFSGTCRGIEILADPMLERVFFNLFDNAVRHGGRVTEITVRCEREPEGILVIVEDNGTGVEIAEKEKIFNRGVGKNTGLGLFLVREILSITGITIKETGVYGKGARFEISVPEGMYRFVKP